LDLLLSTFLLDATFLVTLALGDATVFLVAVAFFVAVAFLVGVAFLVNTLFFIAAVLLLDVVFLAGIFLAEPFLTAEDTDVLAELFLTTGLGLLLLVAFLLSLLEAFTVVDFWGALVILSSFSK